MCSFLALALAASFGPAIISTPTRPNKITNDKQCQCQVHGKEGSPMAALRVAPPIVGDTNGTEIRINARQPPR